MFGQIPASEFNLLSEAEVAALPELPDPSVTLLFGAFFRHRPDDGVEGFSELVKLVAPALERVPTPWRSAAYQWIFAWIEERVPVVESRPVLKAAEVLRPLLMRDLASDVAHAESLLFYLSPPTSSGGDRPATAEERAKAESYIGNICREHGGTAESRDLLFSWCRFLGELPFDAITMRFGDLLEHWSFLESSQRSDDIDDAFMGLLAQAPDADTLARTLRGYLDELPADRRIDLEAFLYSRVKQHDHLHPESVPILGLRLATD